MTNDERRMTRDEWRVPPTHLLGNCRQPRRGTSRKGWWWEVRAARAENGRGGSNGSGGNYGRDGSNGSGGRGGWCEMKNFAKGTSCTGKKLWQSVAAQKWFWDFLDSASVFRNLVLIDVCWNRSLRWLWGLHLRCLPNGINLGLQGLCCWTFLTISFLSTLQVRPNNRCLLKW